MRSRFVCLLILVIVLFFCDLALGSLNIDFLGVLFGDSSDTTSSTLLLNYRLPKAIVAVLSGVALSLSGLIMQTIFRNPLAGPYILGVSSGASLGVAIFLLGMPLLGISLAADIGIALSAFIGAACVMFIVLALSVRLRDVMTVLILGMMISSATVAFVDVLQYFSAESALKGFVLWAMGSLGGVSYEQIVIVTIATILGTALVIKNIRGLDALLLGENYARTLGIDIRRTRLELFIATSLLAGSITAYCGPIAFIGIATPHIARILFRTSAHRPLILSSILLGAAVMLFCDIIASMPFSDSTLPINTITSLFGIPVVVMIVIRSKRGKIM